MVDQSRYAYPKGKNTRAWEKLDSTFKIFLELPYSTKCKRTFSRVQLFVTPWTVAHQGPLFMGFSRQEYWSGLSFPPPGDLPNPGIKPASPLSPALQADSLPTEPLGKPLKGK